MAPDGWSHFRAGRLDQAQASAAAAIAANRDDAPALHLLGVIAWRRGEGATAIATLTRASELLREDEAAGGAVLRDVCEMCRIAGRLEEAAAFGGRAVSLGPQDANAHYNLGIVLQELGDLDAAIEALRRAVLLSLEHGGAHFELAEALLLRGDFAEGWEEYEWRFRVPGAAPLMPETTAPMWSGQPLPRGRLLLVADQGFGDVIQFMRYLPKVEALCNALTIACSAEMEPLVRQLAGRAEIFRTWDLAPSFDWYVALSSLPRMFGTRLETIPSASRYLAADPAGAARWRARLRALTPAGFKTIGLVWAGRPTHGNDANRSMPLAALAPLAALERTVLVALQKGEAAAQVGRYFGAAPLINLGPEIGDFADTAAIVTHLDAVVSVDTAVAHLSGALGQPTHVLLPFAPDWRWLRDRSDSPWYPNVRLYRQPRRGDWTEPVARVAADIVARKL
jgi:tetratricopeptide (TPR) repeat protein